MKNLLVIFILFLSDLVYGQVSIGLNFGINYGNYDTRYTGYFSTFYNMFSYKGGIDLGIELKNGYFIKSGFYYSQRGGTVENNFIDRRDKLISEFFEVPIIINKTFYKKYSFGIGVVLSNLANPIIHTIDEKKYDVDIATDFRWNCYPRFTIEVSYIFGGINTYINKREAYLYSVGNLSLSYRLFQIR